MKLLGSVRICKGTGPGARSLAQPGPGLGKARPASQRGRRARCQRAGLTSLPGASLGLVGPAHFTHTSHQHFEHHMTNFKLRPGERPIRISWYWTDGTDTTGGDWWFAATESVKD